MKHIFSACFLVFSLSSFSQNISISLDQSSTLKELFGKIEGQTDYKFAFTDQVDTNKRYFKEKVNFKNASVQEVLDGLEKDLPFNFTLIGNNITVKQKSTAGKQGTYMLSGTILDDAQQPLPGAGLFIKESKTAVNADENGKFSIRLPAGNYTKAIIYLGFKSK
jgi:hypothetical protein